MGADKVPKIELNNGMTIPAFGLGTWQSPPDQVKQAVKDAIDLGYRHIDCAYVYQNEDEVGEAIKDKIEKGVVTREDLFIVSKLWNTFHPPHLVELSIKESLEKLGLDYLDLYLIHTPLAIKEEDGLFPSTEDGKWIPSDVDIVDTYKAMEELVVKGLTKSIGISNFNKDQVERILENCAIPPVTNQVECHPYLKQKKLIEFCQSKNIVVTAYSPLSAPDSPFRKEVDPILLDNPILKIIADKYEKSVAQICIRWIGLVVIPKSVTKSRIEENIDIFDFELDAEDLTTIDGLGVHYRAVDFNTCTHHKDYPFNDEF